VENETSARMRGSKLDSGKSAQRKRKKEKSSAARLGCEDYRLGRHILKLTRVLKGEEGAGGGTGNLFQSTLEESEQLRSGAGKERDRTLRRLTKAEGAEYHSRA